MAGRARKAPRKGLPKPVEVEAIVLDFRSRKLFPVTYFSKLTCIIDCFELFIESARNFNCSDKFFELWTTPIACVMYMGTS